VLSNDSPIRGGQHEHRQSVPGEILLIAKALIRCDEHLEVVCVRDPQEITISEGVPTALEYGVDVMSGQRMPEGNGHPLIEEDSHKRCSGVDETALCMLEHGVHLFTRHPGKPLQELLDGRVTFEVLEQRLHGHPRSFEEPGPTHLSGDALYGRALRPVEHASA